MNQKNPYANTFLFIILAFLWSGSFINIKIVVDSLPTIFCAMMRVFISLVFLYIFFLFSGKKIQIPSLRFWRSWLAGIFAQAIPFALLFYGEQYTAPALASIINSTTSFWALLLGTILFRDFTQWTSLKIIGLIVGFIGITIIFYPFINKGENNLIGIISITGMAISYAIGGLINQHMIFKNMRVSFETNLFQQHISSVIFLLIISLSFEHWPQTATLYSFKIVSAFLYLGIMATALAWIIYFYLIKEWGAVSAASVMYLVPVLAIVWDLLFLHIIPSHSVLIGASCILCGVILIQLKLKLFAIKIDAH